MPHLHGILLAVACLLDKALSIPPQLTFPVNSQVPPVAYASQPYQFNFSANTFASKSELTYWLESQPKWLLLDSTTRTLFGTPQIRDVGASGFQLVAANADGQTRSTVVLVIVEGQPFEINQSKLIPALAVAGKVSSPSTLILRSNEQFSFAVPRDIFSEHSPDTLYYATLTDSSPLPAWIQFDSNQLLFSGTTPVLLAPPPTQEEYSFNLIASDVRGFAQGVVEFDIQITTEVFAFVEALLSFNVTQGQQLVIPSLLQQLQRDGDPVQRNEITRINSTWPPWLGLNGSDLSFDGIVPSDADSTSFSLTVQDAQGSSASVQINIQISDSSIDLGNVSATEGEYFHYTLSKTLLGTSNPSITISTQPNADWLTFIPSNSSLQGLVPDGIAANNLNISFVINGGTSVFKEAFLLINVRSKDTNPTTPTPKTSSSTTSAPTITGLQPPPSNKKHTNKAHTVKLVVSIVVPILVVIFLIALICIIWSRRRRKAQQRRNESITILNALGNGTGFKHQATDVPPVPIVTRSNRPAEMVSILPPQAELPSPPAAIPRTKSKKKSSQSPRNSARRSRSTWNGPGPLASLYEEDEDEERDSSSSLKTDSDRTSGQFKVLADIPEPSSDRRSTSGRVGPRNYSRKRTTLAAVRNSKRLSQDRRSSQRLSQISSTSNGLPQRLSGAGHGSGYMQSPSALHAEPPWQTTFGALPSAADGSVEAALNSFDITLGRNNGVSAVESALSAMQPPPRVARGHSSKSSLDAHKERYYRQRARESQRLSRYSFAGPSRPVSSIKESPPQKDSPTLGSEYNSIQTTPRSQYEWSGWPDENSPLQPQGGFQPPRDRNYSVVSNVQFDSATSSSSDSQWEDDDRMSEEIVADERLWQSGVRTYVKVPSPQPLFSGRRESAADRAGQRRPSASQTAGRLADQRLQISVAERAQQRSQLSHHGSVKFI